jgi:hypothetical protein
MSSAFDRAAPRDRSGRNGVGAWTMIGGGCRANVARGGMSGPTHTDPVRGFGAVAARDGPAACVRHAPDVAGVASAIGHDHIDGRIG